MSEASDPRPPARGLGKSFANLFTANIASSLGDGIARVAIPLLGARLTDDALLISGIAALALLPWLFFAIPSGILIDRIDRRKALALAQAVRVSMAVLLLVLVATDSLTIWWLYLVVFIFGAFETLYDGAIRAVMPSLVEKSDLPRANSRIEAGELVTQSFLAAPLTSALFAVSVLIPLGVNAFVFACAGVLALLLPRAAAGALRAPQVEGVAWYRQFADGWRFLRGEPVLFKLWMTSTLIGLCWSLATSSMVLFALGPLAVPEALFGVFMLAGAIGGILGSLSAGRLKTRFGTGPVMATTTVLAGAAVLVMGLFPNVWVAVGVLLVTSAAILIWNVLVMSLRQAAIPQQLFGRVNGTWRTLLWGTMPLGMVIGGLIGRIDLALPFIIGGAFYLLFALIWFRFYRTLPDPESFQLRR